MTPRLTLNHAVRIILVAIALGLVAMNAQAGTVPGPSGCLQLQLDTEPQELRLPPARLDLLAPLAGRRRRLDDLEDQRVFQQLQPRPRLRYPPIPLHLLALTDATILNILWREITWRDN